MPHKIGIYTRVSTDEQAQVFEGSLDSQKYLLEQFVDSKNQEKDWGNVVEVYCDEGFTAGNEKRPAYRKILTDARSGKINLILVTDITRFTRDRADFSKISKELEQIGTKLLSMRQEFLDTETPGGRLMMHFLVNMAQFEREQIAERVAINCHARAQRGLMNGGRTSLGFDRHSEKTGLLLINQEEAKIVNTIFNTFLECGSKSTTIKRLHEMGIYPKRMNSKQTAQNSPRWSVQTLAIFLRQPAYIGLREINKQNKDKNQSSLKPWQRYSQVQAPWKALIDSDLFHEVQKILDTNEKIERARLSDTHDRAFYLSHMMECGICKRALVGQSAHNHKGDIYRYYFHSRKFHDSPCSLKRINADEIETIVLDKFRGAVLTAGYFEKLEQRLLIENESRFSINDEELKRITKRISDIQSEIDGMWKWQKISDLGEEALKEISSKLNTLSKDKQEAQSYLTQLQSEEKVKAEVGYQVKFVESNMKNLLKGWSKSPPATKKRLFRRLIKRITVTQEEINIAFWLDEVSFQERSQKASAAPSGAEAKIFQFADFSQNSLDHNQANISSPVGKIGRPSRT